MLRQFGTIWEWKPVCDRRTDHFNTPLHFINILKHTKLH